MRWHHGGIEVDNLADSIQFYENIFDFKIEQVLALNGEKIAFLRNEEVRIELIESKDNPALQSSVHLAWQVDDIEGFMVRLKRKGLLPSEGPYKLKNGWKVVFYEGRGGEVIELIQIGKLSQS